jgi:hypothetical protein
MADYYQVTWTKDGVTLSITYTDEEGAKNFVENVLEPMVRDDIVHNVHIDKIQK